MAMSLNVCGRPDINDITNFSGYDAYRKEMVGGDKNYGYVTKCVDEDRFVNCEDLPNGSSSTFMKTPNLDFVKDPAGCGDDYKDKHVICPSSQSHLENDCSLKTMPAACNYGGNACEVFGTIDITYERSGFCQSNWDGVDNEENRIKCCGDLESTSDICHPEWCSNNQKKCATTMLDVCTDDVWNQNNYKTRACENFINRTSQINRDCGLLDPNLKGLNCAQAIIKNSVSRFYNTGGKPTDNTPFISRQIEYCRLYPGLCDSILDAEQGGVCKNYSLSDLDPDKYKNRENDPDGTNLLKTCGCFLEKNSKNYILDKDFGVACNSICSYPGTIPKVNRITKQPEVCEGNVCVLNDITVNSINSTGGAVNMNTYCGQCSDELCRCYFNNVNLPSYSDTGATYQLTTNCGECFKYDPNNPTQLEKINCDGSESPPKPPTPPPSPPSDDNRFLNFLKNNWILIILLLIIFIVIIVLIVFFIKKNKKEQSKVLFY